jgi:hypothetical protein
LKFLNMETLSKNGGTTDQKAVSNQSKNQKTASTQKQTKEDSNLSLEETRKKQTTKATTSKKRSIIHTQPTQPCAQDQQTHKKPTSSKKSSLT